MLWWTLRQLRSADPLDRELAARKLGYSKNVRAIKPLIGALKDAHRKVRKAAAEALEELRYEPQGIAERPWIFVAREAWDSAVSLGAIAIEPLIVALNDHSTYTTAAKAAEALGAIGDAGAVEALIAALKDSASFSVDTRVNAARALGKIGDPSAIAPLTAALRDPALDVLSAAASALDALRYEVKDAAQQASIFVAHQDWENATKLGAVAIEPLIGAFKSLYGRDSEKAAEALGKIGGQRAVGALIDALKDQDERKCRVAAEVLGEIGDARAVEPLSTALKSSEWQTRRIVAEALGKIRDPRAVAPLVAAVKDPDSETGIVVAMQLRKFGKAAVEPLIGLLNEADEWMRRYAKMRGLVSPTLSELRRLSRLESFKPLHRELETYEKMTRVYNTARSCAARELGEIGDPRAVEPLIATLDADVDTAASALGEMGDTRAVEPLIAALKDSDSFRPDTRSSAARALGKICDPRAIEALIGALEDSDKNVRTAAADALALLGNPTVEPLVAAKNKYLHEAEERAVTSIRVSQDEFAMEMTDQDLIGVLQRLCNAYVVNDRSLIAELEPRATAIGEYLHQRGGISEMRRIFAELGGVRGARTLEMHWGGIGDWRG